MIIGIDGNEANVTYKVGVSVYTFQLLNYFQKQASENLQFIVYLRKSPQSDLPPSTEFFTYKIIWGPMLWSQLFLPLHLWLFKIQGKLLNVFFSPAHYIPRNCPFKTIVTIHDLSYIYFPDEFLKKDLFQLKNWTEYSLKNSSKIIAVSKTTKKDIIHEYGINDEKISVVYNGYEHHYENSPPPAKPVISEPYFLYVGTIQPRKNLSFLISAFAQFSKRNPTYKLVLAGKKGWLYENIYKKVEQLRMENTILFPGFVSESTKDVLYKNAAAFIMPSLYEGFGIPLLEAMAHACPTLSSFSSSLPEVGGEACLYFDPKDNNDLVEKMETIVSDKNLKRKLISAGKKRVENFSWLESGKQTLSLIQSICE